MVGSSNMVLLSTYTLLAAVTMSTVEAFLPNSFATKNTLTIVKYASSSDDHNDSYEQAILKNKKRTCIQHFLSQRSLQTFLFFLREVRDPHSGDWIEGFLEAPSLLAYHGTGALNTTRFDQWDTYFLEMAKQPNERMIIQSRRNSASAFKGGSKNNPFLQNDRDHLVETTVDINPSSLANRVVSVRELIAKEWAVDLELVKRYNDQILHTYEYRVKNKGKMRVDSCFERNAMIILESSMTMATSQPSPLRKGSFDLLLLLSLHESIHRVLRDYKDSGRDKQVSMEWLREFFVDRIAFFDGIQYHFGRADDFIEDLLKTSPTMRKTDEGTALVDTQSVAADIINTRSEVLLDWIDIMSKVPDDHIGLQQTILLFQTKAWTADMETDSTTNADADIGAFE